VGAERGTTRRLGHAPILVAAGTPPAAA
jgi:hypothetical protein